MLTEKKRRVKEDFNCAQDVSKRILEMTIGGKTKAKESREGVEKHRMEQNENQRNILKNKRDF